MADARVFQILGLLVEHGFLTPNACASLRGDMSRAATEAAGVVHAGQNVIDRGHRSTKRVSVGTDAARLVEARLAAVRPRLEAHFGVTLRGMQEPQFLRYATRDFFRCHADTSDAENAVEYLRERKISTVIFLGHPGECGSEKGSGGELVFHGLIDDPRLRDRGFPFDPDEGTLLAFPSTILHEVTPVASGERYSIVTWFY